MSEARRLLGRARRRVGRALASPAEGLEVTAEHWGEEAREKAEGTEWRGLYWQSHVLTARHINKAISGDPDVSWLPFTKQRFLRKPVDVALSLGCGYGIVERVGLELEVARRFDAYDIAPEAVAVAQQEAEKAGVADRVRYEAADLNAIELEPGRYGAVFGAQTLHHIEALEHLLDQVHESLTPDGLFVVNEYVGPARFQFADELLPLMNGLLAALPESHRRSLKDGSVRVEAVRPSARAVADVDPSESIRSDEILGLIEERFEIVHRTDFGGTLLQFVLADIAGNFDPADPKDVAMIDLVCLYEKTLIEQGVLASDFVYLVARRRAS